MLNKILNLAKEKGFSDFQIVKDTNETKTLTLEKGVLSGNEVNFTTSYTLKGIFNGKAVFANSENIDDDVINQTLATMIENAKCLTSSEEEFIFEGSPTYPEIITSDFDFDTIPFEEKMSFLKTMEKNALQTKNLKLVHSCKYIEMKQGSQIINTKGLNVNYSNSFCAAYVVVIVEKNTEIINHFKIKFARQYSDLNPAWLGMECGLEANKKLGSTTNVRCGSMPVVIAPTAMVSLLLTFKSIFTASARFTNNTKLSDKLNTQIASPLFSLVDNGACKKAFFQSAFDAEGVASQKNIFVEKGVFKKFANNLKYAAFYKEDLTGNGGNNNTVSFQNLHIKNGATPLEELIAPIDEGLYVKEFQGLHAGVNPVSGDFSLQTNGILITKGQFSRPYRMVVVSGNFYELLQNITGIGNDLVFPEELSFAAGSPSICVKGLVVAGEKK